MIKKRTYTKPGRLMLLYTSIMPLMFLYTIFKIELRSNWMFFAFIISCNLLAALGFKVGACNVKLNQYKTERKFNSVAFVNKLFWVALIISLPKYMLYTGQRNINVFQYIIHTIIGQVNYLESYNLRHTVENVTGIWKIINYAIVLFGPLHWIYMPLSMYFWKELKLYKKIGTALIYIIYIFQYVGSGASVGAFYFCIFLISTWLIKDAKRDENDKLHKKLKNFIKKQKRIVSIVIVVFILVSTFSIIMNDRSSGREKTTINLGTTVSTVNTDSLIWKLLPPGFRSTAVSLYAYTLKPYVALDMGLSIAKSVDIPLCFGMGGSWFLASEFKQLFGYDVINHTYNMRIDEAFGYNYYTQWHTVYLWIANDWTFLGVPFALMFLMIIWGLAWRDYLNNRNIFAFLLMILFAEFVIFIPMNNQVFQHSETLFSYWGLIIAWLYTRKRYAFKS